jgi:hypothetical protein
MIDSQNWAVRQVDTATAIVATTQTATHTIELFHDGIIAIQVRDDANLPEIVEKTKHQSGYVALSKLEIEEAYHLLHAS